ncbi:MAG: NAD(P)H-quinone oxidoreductase [Pseudomonadales bacterium]|jgi:putative PIG3 family NAD(P)H quinone oxidoreductase|nr:NAD(P)H-quinone oxidoreductase [Pseudomonadales bacterium]
MKAIDIRDDRLVWAEIDDPVPGVGEILVRNRATAVNRADLVQRSGAYPPPPGASPILGLECAGVVEAIGEGVARFAPGDQVCALLAGGGYAEKVVVPAGQALPVPEGIDLVQAAALPEVFATAYLNLYMEAAAQVGERFLVHAGASGVGTAAIQLGRAFGNPVWVTAGSAEKIDRCVELGAEGGHDRHQGPFAEAVGAWTGGAGFDVVLDPVGGAYLADNLKALAPDGRLVIIGLMGGPKAELEIGLMMVKRLRVIGSTLRARSVAAKSRVMDGLERRVWPRIASGEIRPIIDATFPLQEAEQAHARVAGNGTFGKVVLTLD